MSIPGLSGGHVPRPSQTTQKEPSPGEQKTSRAASPVIEGSKTSPTSSSRTIKASSPPSRSIVSRLFKAFKNIFSSGPAKAPPPTRPQPQASSPSTGFKTEFIELANDTTAVHDMVEDLGGCDKLSQEDQKMYEDFESNAGALRSMMNGDNLAELKPIQTPSTPSNSQKVNELRNRIIDLNNQIRKAFGQEEPASTAAASPTASAKASEPKPFTAPKPYLLPQSPTPENKMEFQEKLKELGRTYRENRNIPANRQQINETIEEMKKQINSNISELGFKDANTESQQRLIADQRSLLSDLNQWANALQLGGF